MFSHIMLLGLSEFSKNLCKEGPSFLAGVNKNSIESCTTKKCDVLKAKYAFVKSVCCVLSVSFAVFI